MTYGANGGGFSRLVQMPKQKQAEVANPLNIGDWVKIRNYAGKVGRIVELAVRLVQAGPQYTELWSSGSHPPLTSSCAATNWKSPQASALFAAASGARPFRKATRFADSGPHIQPCGVAFWILGVTDLTSRSCLGAGFLPSQNPAQLFSSVATKASSPSGRPVLSWARISLRSSSRTTRARNARHLGASLSSGATCTSVSSWPR